MKMPVILRTDSYKGSHHLCYPPGMDGLFAYLESRGGRYDHTLFFGLQHILKEYLGEPVTRLDVMRASQFFKQHGVPFPEDGWNRIVETYDGFLPISIRAVEEGSVVPTHNVLMTVESTDPQLPWVTTWVETLLMRVWYPTTVATVSMYAKKAIWEALNRTADDPESEIDFKLHDFGARGVSSGESAALGGAAHLVNFKGSDTIEGVYLANDSYWDHRVPMSGYSIPAAEHSTIISWGRENEADAYANILTQFANPGAVVAVVSDSYNLWNAIENIWGGQLRQRVIDSGATVVIRPDSGNPIEVVERTLKMLDAKFGSTINRKGYRVLNHVRVIQGDGVTPSSIEDILANVARAGYSATNLAFGMGGGLLQQVDRDTQRFAYKTSAAHFPDRGWVDIKKDPITDPGKRSKSGKLDLYMDGGRYRTGVWGESWSDRKMSQLRVVYNNGVLASRFLAGATGFSRVRDNALSGLKKLISPY